MLKTVAKLGCLIFLIFAAISTIVMFIAALRVMKRVIRVVTA